ncbi:MAG: rhodanese-like domain-containing protein [Pseudomonadota bacterium]
MYKIYRIVLGAALIASVCLIIGLGSNLVRSKPIPWFYAHASEVTISGQRIPFVTIEEAHKWVNDPRAVFIDTREEKDFMLGHVPGALFLSPEEKENRFPIVEPFITHDTKLILYCYGPECDMAEKISAFLIDFGYSNIVIMKEGYIAWEKKGLATEK